MDKQKINKQQYQFFSRELRKHQHEGRVSDEQVTGILDTYEVKAGINFIQVLVVVGSILIGLAALSFIASNWQEMSKITKFLLIVLSYLVVVSVGYLIRDMYPKTSRSLFYLGILIYGAGIFLVGQTFNLGGRFTEAFLLWAIGVFPLAIYLKDRFMFVFVHVLLFTYLNGQYVYDDFPVLMLLFIPLLYLGYRVIEEKRIVFLTNLLSLNFLWYILDQTLDLEVELVIAIYFAIGLLLYFIKMPVYSSIFKLQGNLLFSIFGFLLTFKFVWEDLVNTDYSVHLLFSVLFILFLLYLVKMENLISLILIGAIILRFYFDTMYDFMPKSIFFLTGGVILLGFGFYFEHKRRIIRREENEK